MIAMYLKISNCPRNDYKYYKKKKTVNISQMMLYIHFKLFQCELDMLYVT